MQFFLSLPGEKGFYLNKNYLTIKKLFLTKKLYF